MVELEGEKHALVEEDMQVHEDAGEGKIASVEISTRSCCLRRMRRNRGMRAPILLMTSAGFIFFCDIQNVFFF